MAGGMTAGVIASFVLGLALIITLVVLVLAAIRGRGAIAWRAGIALVLVVIAGALVAWILGSNFDPAEALGR